ncbi:Histidine--tRNA ligase [Acorus gramineus]|uniref:Histidine--tRNA ligase n=1 Tax=Acorus gramineus TaxID=55184 RepID=A0AAV9B7Q2_ACOGR|nr:Histidine--tRNA ligase [Acorus gramineus]
MVSQLWVTFIVLGGGERKEDASFLFRALEKSKALSKVVFDLSLARGLDYYTGVGSIAAGECYDNLVGISVFSRKQVPAVAVSLGIEQVFTIMEQLEKERNQVIRATETQVLVAVLGNDLPLATEVVSELWAAGIKAEFGTNKKFMKQYDRAKQSGIPWIMTVGKNEQKEGTVLLQKVEYRKGLRFQKIGSFRNCKKG